MVTLGKELAKQIKSSGPDEYLQRFLRSCNRAVEYMHEINNFINRFIRDTEYKSSIRKVSDRIRNMSELEIANIDTKYGRLMIEGHMTFKKETDPNFNSKCYLMFFQYRMLAFEVQGKPNKNMFWYMFANKDTSSDDTKDNYDFLTSIPITSSMTITIDKQAEGGIMSVNNMRDFLPIANESFKLKFKEMKTLEELKGKIEKLIVNASPCPSHEHSGHEFVPFMKHHIVNIADPRPTPKCGSCKHFLFGQLLFGYHCKTCDSIYHEKCFLEGEANELYGNYHSFPKG